MVLDRLLTWLRTRHVHTTQSDAESPESERIHTASDLQIVHFINQRGGQTTQQELITNVDIPKSTLSRYLADLEDDGVLVCRPTGAQTIVELDDGQAIDALARRGSRQNT